MSVNNKIAIFPGTFDPFTLGHHDIVTRGLKIFDKIFIAIGNNPKKDRYFNVNLIKEKIDNLYKDKSKINVINYNKLTASLAKDLNSNIETVFLITSPKLAPISSTIIRDVIRYGGDINKYLPYKINLDEK